MSRDRDGASSSSDSVPEGVGIADPVEEGKKPVWRKPSSGVLTEIVGPVMDESSWPDLSEAAATMASRKSLSSDSLKNLADGSVSLPLQSALPSGSAIVNPSMNHVVSSPRPNSSQSHASPSRQKSMKRGVGSANPNTASINGTTQANGEVVPPAASIEIFQMPSERPLAAPEQPAGENHNRNGSVSYQGPRPGFNHPRRSSNGGGLHHGSYGSRRNQDYVGNGWNSNRNFGSRDSQMPQQYQQQRPFYRPFYRPPPPPLVSFFSHPPPAQAFGNPMVFPDVPSMLYYVPPPPPPPLTPFMPQQIFTPPVEHHLRKELLFQIEYYFSHVNLPKDIYLREHMDSSGWVPISLIAGFTRVKQLTNNVQFILDTLRQSEVVEIEGDKIRRRGDWHKWLLPSSHTVENAASSSSPSLQESASPLETNSHGLASVSYRVQAESSYLSSEAVYDNLVNGVRNISLEAGTAAPPMSSNNSYEVTKQ